MRASIFSKYIYMLLILVTLVAAHEAIAAENSYVEDFTTKSYCNTDSTTAFWNTLAGELKLPPLGMTLVDSIDTSGSSRGVAIAGDYAFVADGSSGLLVIDISDPANIASVGSSGTPGSSRGVAISGD